MKKQISAKIIADSINSKGNRITSIIVTFPRFILSELNTHRILSKSSASSRAIPFKKMLEMVQEDPFIPVGWQKEHKGMQGTKYIDEQDEIENCISVWLKARDNVVKQANLLGNTEGFTKVTKQLCNRLLEPFMWHTVLITATSFENFFNLRCPIYDFKYINDTIYRSKKDVLKFVGINEYIPEFEKTLGEFTDLDWLKINKGQAEIHMMALAEAMWDVMNNSIPKQLKTGEWHIPFGDNIDLSHSSLDPFKHLDRGLTQEEVDLLKIKIATARCARGSYGNFEGANDYFKDIELFEKLSSDGHASPFEHCAQAPTPPQLEDTGWSGNFKGFIQFRKIMEQRGELKTSTN